ncbi:putative bifunctional diguanylate cyclase/phosphodiesterase [Marinospirillum alkaliphilum]|uniref:cyclic-guanylate-specific phosphodiesterase n=1 Tax=Marinospirillum alkaliphilum DSM 21637 TaxID=1122209 RepID=A0A1K1U1Z1_9GAMM|nr:bifunctional diguanylate cyclase/phosphodiesterase [Marinospirillum alkaliphilum]SFX06786.1 diguanylate cyclase (GGDEF) domain-containing protein [Marinospirillum alkaliphilum DSM 21637]
MKASRSLLLIFLLPAFLVIGLTLMLGYWSITSLRAQFDNSSHLQSTDLQTIHASATFSRDMALVHEQVVTALANAKTGSKSELELYFMHSDITEELGQLLERVEVLATSDLLREVNHGSADKLRREFQLYRQFVIMATDIAAIDPPMARYYIEEAQQHFIQFSGYAHRITQLLSERGEQRRNRSEQVVHDHFNTIALLGFFSLILMLLLALFAARLVSFRLRVVADALLKLARSYDSKTLPELPAIEALKGKGDGEFSLIARALLDFRDAETRRRAAEEQVEHLAYYDPLTQLANRRLLTEHLQHSLKMNSRSHQLGALIYFDLDHFKAVNDTGGLEVGDLLLQQVADRLRTLEDLRPMLGRPGGDEFVLLLDSLGTDPALVAPRVEQLAEQVRTLLNEPFNLAGENYQITPSIGIVIFDGIEYTSDDLFRFADSAMYQAKQAGRNTTCFYDPEIQSALEARTQLERDLRLALERQELYLVYQLQVDTAAQPIGAEALLRWQSERHGLVSPGVFIPLAEETGLIIPIGYWVLQTACQQLLTWQQNPKTRHLVLAVNVSARQFKQADFVERVRKLLDETGAPAHQLKLELTESTVLDRVEETIEKMKQIKELGLTFSMDDFGTGYSSLQYLKRLPLDQIKIDQSFVRDIHQDPEDAAIVKTIIAMSKALRLHVIAEGVETEAQQFFLMEQGCEAFQGYLFCRPMTASELDEQLLITH